MAAMGELNVVDSPPFGSRSVDCFEKLEQIGQGTHGSLPMSAIREIKILNRLHHENVIKLKEIVTSPGREKDDQGRPGKLSMFMILVNYFITYDNKYKGGIYMVFEYMEHDLKGLASHPGMRFTIPQIKCYMRQLLTGLHYCHVNEVLHRDIKGSNVLIDDEGNLKLADFGLARSYSNEHSANLTNRVISLWYRPPELLLGERRYGPAVDIWSVGCILAELLHGKPIFPGKDEPEQINKIFELCGAPDEVNWPGVQNTPLYNQFKPTRPMKRRLREVFRHFDQHALELLEKMLTLDPAQRIPAKDALDADYFWTYPLPCDPKRYLPYTSQGGQQHAQMRQGPVHPIHGFQPTVASGHHYGKPQSPSSGPGRYPPGGNPSGGYNHLNRGGPGGAAVYGSGPYPPQVGGAPYVSSGMPAGPNGGRCSGYGVGAQNYPQGGPPYGGSAAGHGSNMMIN
ncbi:hypothetical protein TSUD_132610 [Trifolium subterraneum]|uniref:Protein kinase domain-containing protein n=1 Tax=Trifolium subterraneum TaxID=3900 RepID=A0A2Z6LRH8_TRISU|nr:hypothetical protein TSUD_132610 [Trifolium subterraneum]